MDIKGCLKKCDLCGAMVFLETNGEGETDGGFTRWNKFVSAPGEWKRRELCGNYYDLCPKCNAEYLRRQEQMECDFMKSILKAENDIQMITKEIT